MPEPGSMDGFMRLPSGGWSVMSVPNTRRAQVCKGLMVFCLLACVPLAGAGMHVDPGLAGAGTNGDSEMGQAGTHGDSGLAGGETHGDPELDQVGTHGDLGLDEAIRRTLARNPQLVAVGHQIEAQLGRVTQSRIAPAPELGLDLQNVVGTGAYGGFKGAETTLSLGWVLERGKRQNYIAASQAGVSVLEAQAEVRRLDALALTALLFLDNLEFQERYAISLKAIAGAEQSVAAVRERVQSGLAPAVDLARARSELAKVRLHSADMEHDLTNARHRLATQWGEVHPDFREVAGRWQELPDPGSFAALVELLDRSPDLSRYISQRRLQEAELRLAQSQSRPDWRVSAGIRRLEITRDYGFTVGISIPLKAGETNRGRVQEARANLARVNAEQAATRVQIEARLFEIHHEMMHSLIRARIIRDEILPQLQEAAEQTRQGAELGRYSYFELQQLESELLFARSDLVQAAIDARRQMTEIERLTGAPMPSAARSAAP